MAKDAPQSTAADHPEGDAQKDAGAPYIVLARKYRPSSFESLIGQQPMVQTLGNAFKAGRIHHAFILTGVRGVGKTTTARILARAFNYVDETGAHPSLDLEKPGEHCQAIIEGRHVDVHEMDAASNTSIDDIREIIDSVKYGPVSAPYKVFIIDEVHMLSNSAFNGLLKTLEEPPPYVKFIFATTEIRKVPVTILSRCQRFDLRRINPEIMTGYLTGLLEKESIAVEPEALALIVRAGEGSVRDCLSLLDQAIAHGGGDITVQTVQAMLGLADRAAIIDLFEALMQGAVEKALTQNQALYLAGADPVTLLTDLANLTHLVTRLKMVPAAAGDQSLTPDERERGSALAQKLGVRALTRAWQLLSRGIEEALRAPNVLQAEEMVLIRLAHVADLPTPDELIEKLQAGGGISAQSGQSATGQSTSGQSGSGSGGRPSGGASPHLAGVGPGPQAYAGAGATTARQNAPQPAPGPAPDPVAHMPQPQSFAQLVALAGEKRDLVVKYALESDVRPVSFAPGRIEVQLVEGANPAILATLSARLKSWTGRTWMVTLSREPQPAAPSVKEQRLATRKAQEDAALDDPLVQAVLTQFPGARLVDVRVKTADHDISNEIPLPDPDGDEDDEDE